MKYFKKHYESCDREWTEFGCYEESDITPEGDFCVSVYSVECNDGKCSYDCYDNYFELDDIQEITKEESLEVIKQLHKVDEIQEQINTIIKAILNES